MEHILFLHIRPARLQHLIPNCLKLPPSPSDSFTGHQQELPDPSHHQQKGDRLSFAFFKKHILKRLSYICSYFPPICRELCLAQQASLWALRLIHLRTHKAGHLVENGLGNTGGPEKAHFTSEQHKPKLNVLCVCLFFTIFRTLAHSCT